MIKLFITGRNPEKSMQLKSALNILKVEYEEVYTPEYMPSLEIDGERFNFSQAKSIIYEHIKKNRRYRREMKKRKLVLVERKLSLWQRIKKAWKQWRKG